MPDPTRQTLSSTEVSALFGVNPWVTEFMLYQRFAEGVDIDKPADERMDIGKLMQPVIIELARRQLRLDVKAFDESMYLTSGQLGASFDASVVCPTRGTGVLETKNVDWVRWRETWTFDADGACVAAPPHIEIQVQVQMHVAGAKWGVIAVLVGGNDLVLLERVPDPEIVARLEAAAAGFFERVARREEPDVLAPADLDLVSRLCPEYSQDPPLDLRGDVEGADLEELMLAYVDAGERRREADAEEKEYKARALRWLQHHDDAGLVFTDNGTVKAKRGADQHYRLPGAVADLLAYNEPVDSEASPRLAELVSRTRALEGAVARRGSVRLTWTPRD